VVHRTHRFPFSCWRVPKKELLLGDTLVAARIHHYRGGGQVDCTGFTFDLATLLWRCSVFVAHDDAPGAVHGCIERRASLAVVEQGRYSRGASG
jgi:hypothetical protein